MDLEVLKVLADENRLAIVRLLADGERCVCELASALGLSDALVSHHVKRLSDAGVVRTRRVGRWLHCRLVPARMYGLATSFTEVGERAAVLPRSETPAPACDTCAPTSGRTSASSDLERTTSRD